MISARLDETAFWSATGPSKRFTFSIRKGSVYHRPSGPCFRLTVRLPYCTEHENNAAN